MLALLATSTQAVAQREIPLTLAEAEDIALAAEPGQQAFSARAAALAERAIASGELPDPVLRLGLNNYPIESGGFTTEGMTNASLGIRQVFPAGDTRSLSRRQLSAFSDEMTGQAAARGRSVLAATRIAWLDLYFWNHAHALVSDSRPFFDDLATATRSLYSVGSKSQQDVLRAELELSRLNDRLIDIERQRSLARTALGEWVGDAAKRRLADKLPAWESLPPEHALLTGLAAHPLLQAADAKISALEAGVELADQRSKPGWSLDVAYSYRDGMLDDGTPRSDFISLGVTVDLPYFRKKAVDSTLSAALQERSAAMSDKERLSRALQRELQGEYALWLDLSRRLALYEESIVGQTRAHAEAALLAYQSDRGDFADVMRGFIDDLNTRTEYVKLQVERAKSYAVLASLGGLQR